MNCPIWIMCDELSDMDYPNMRNEGKTMNDKVIGFG